MNMLDRAFFESLSDLGPFEIKDELIKLAKAGAETSSKLFLNAGRGNPNWIATRAREAFFLLGEFALSEAKRSYLDPHAGLAGMPARDGAHARFQKWIRKRVVTEVELDDEDVPPANTLAKVVDYAIAKFGFDPDAFVHELTDSIIGDSYRSPTSMTRPTRRSDVR
jgi:aspartate 4-decarboxylase